MKSVTAIAIVAATAGAASAQFTIGDFEGNDPGTWGYWNNGVQTPIGDDANLEVSNLESTSGANSVRASNMGFDQNLAYSADFATRQEFLNNNTLVFDAIFPEYSTSGFWEIFEIVLNSNAGFNAVFNIQNNPNNLTNSEGGTAQVGWGPDGGGRRVVTFELDYSSQLALWGGQDMGYLELVFALNNDSVHNVVYFDNFRLVPAPGAAAAFLALGTVAARRRR